MPRAPGDRHRERHRRRHRRWQEMKAEREMWRRMHRGRQHWAPWWLHARMRRRIVAWFGVALFAGLYLGFEIARGEWRVWQVVVVAAVMWGASGAIAWQMTRPLLLAVHAARDIGDGKLGTRIPVSHDHDEMHILATAINDMAARIEAQMKEQRQLLAAVSHELRTPLGHIRVLIDTARDAGGRAPAALDEMEREVIVLDDLVGKLLAQSRLEFGTLDRRPIELGTLVTDVATCAGIALDAIEAIGDTRAPIDPTLVRRAVANLIDNARVHGGGAVAVRIARRDGQVVVEVDDAGPGVPASRRADAFRAFVPSAGGGLGLGLALVSRIAVAHGGGAWIADRPGGGARVGFSVAVV
jgi:signal transduction histidine kinase|nr:HAMP domain-containing sensor histidine kinase [Kofleriaceae bacterium]